MERSEIEAIAKRVADDIIAKYRPPKSIEAGLVESMGEEHAAMDYYYRRAEDARDKGDKAIATVYDTIAEEEGHHYREFEERLKKRSQTDKGLRDTIIGAAMGAGAIPLHGRETRKERCYGCRIDPSKPLEAGNVMATTAGAIGTLSAEEVRNWCSEIVEVTDGRCERVRKIREAARECRLKYPSDTKKFFECYGPAWAAITK